MAIRQEQLHDEQDVDLFARYMRSLLAKGEGFFVQPSDHLSNPGFGDLRGIGRAGKTARRACASPRASR